jgi:hypothetical protein
MRAPQFRQTFALKMSDTSPCSSRSIEWSGVPVQPQRKQTARGGGGSLLRWFGTFEMLPELPDAEGVSLGPRDDLEPEAGAVEARYHERLCDGDVPLPFGREHPHRVQPLDGLVRLGIEAFEHLDQLRSAERRVAFTAEALDVRAKLWKLGQVVSHLIRDTS